jgi:hypothetical protein
MYVTGLFHYPVKSLRGCEVLSLSLGARGPLHDRAFMLVDEAGRFVTQRTEPRLATYAVTVTHSALHVTAPDGATLELPLEAGGPTRSVTIWKDTVLAVDCHDTAAHWFSSRLGRSLRLVRMPDSTQRTLDPTFSPSPDAHTGFADAYPVLLTNTASLDAFNSGRALPLGMERFRPNVVVASAEPWSEDEWKTVQVGDVVFDLVKPCSRCVVITTDQRTGQRPDGSAPLTDLAATRTLQPFGAIFGQNAVHRSLGTLRVGDPVTVLERQPKPPFAQRPQG